MQVVPVSSASPSTSSAPAQQSAFGLDFQSLLSIILTQLTYQDPLKPMDNFQFVSQLAEFSQLQQTQALNSTLTNLLTSQSSAQATGLLGHTVAVTPTTGSTPVVGTVTAISLSGSSPSLTIKTSAGQVLSSIPLTNVETVQ